MFSNFVPSTKCEYDVYLRLCRPRPHAVTAVCCQTPKAPALATNGRCKRCSRKREAAPAGLPRISASWLPVVGWVTPVFFFCATHCSGFVSNCIFFFAETSYSLCPINKYNFSDEFGHR